MDEIDPDRAWLRDLAQSSVPAGKIATGVTTPPSTSEVYSRVRHLYVNPDGTPWYVSSSKQVRSGRKGQKKGKRGKQKRQARGGQARKSNQQANNSKSSRTQPAVSGRNRATYWADDPKLRIDLAKLASLLKE